MKGCNEEFAHSRHEAKGRSNEGLGNHSDQRKLHMKNRSDGVGWGLNIKESCV